MNLVGLQGVVECKKKTRIEKCVELARILEGKWRLMKRLRFKRGLDLINCFE